MRRLTLGLLAIFGSVFVLTGLGSVASGTTKTTCTNVRVYATHKVWNAKHTKKITVDTYKEVKERVHGKLVLKKEHVYVTSHVCRPIAISPTPVRTAPKKTAAATPPSTTIPPTTVAPTAPTPAAVPPTTVAPTAAVAVDSSVVVSVTSRFPAATVFVNGNPISPDPGTLVLSDIGPLTAGETITATWTSDMPGVNGSTGTFTMPSALTLVDSNFHYQIVQARGANPDPVISTRPCPASNGFNCPANDHSAYTFYQGDYLVASSSDPSSAMFPPPGACTSQVVTPLFDSSNGVNGLLGQYFDPNSGFTYLTYDGLPYALPGDADADGGPLPLTETETCTAASLPSTAAWSGNQETVTTYPVPPAGFQWQLSYSNGVSCSGELSSTNPDPCGGFASS